ncbi:putative HNH restriction endonuclease [Neobacillus niacini]|uniref:HNH endonuclease n=1 Tax=Neobacillus driksii TaxID=3035913 RepID=UPI002786D1F2|nr:HNH endonuclease [Neobacillus niacini]MDQ0972410.1 putative HNH restriction endonuclease [Neobacillus niacini]
MKEYEREVISIPASGTLDLIYKYGIHARPDKKGYPYKNSLYYTFRGKGGVMERLYFVEDIFILDPYDINMINNTIQDTKRKERVIRYIEERKNTYHFNEQNTPYKFYMLKPFLELKNKPKHPHQANHCYFTIKELLSEKTELKVSNGNTRVSYLNNSAFTAEEIANNSTYSEGSVQKVLVNKYERNSKARQESLNHYGYNCVVCNFNFEKAYGELAKGIIQVHHLKPLHEIASKYEVDPIRDLRPVCPNCHSVIHSRRPAYEIEELREILKRLK